MANEDQDQDIPEVGLWTNLATIVLLVHSMAQPLRRLKLFGVTLLKSRRKGPENSARQTQPMN